MPVEEDLFLRRTRGSEVHMSAHTLPTEEDEARMLANRDVDDMASHRMDHVHSGVATRHVVKKKTSDASVYNIQGLKGISEEQAQHMSTVGYIFLFYKFRCCYIRLGTLYSTLNCTL